MGGKKKGKMKKKKEGKKKGEKKGGRGNQLSTKFEPLSFC